MIEFQQFYFYLKKAYCGRFLHALVLYKSVGQLWNEMIFSEKR